MPGMTSGPDIDNPAVEAAFRAALIHQGIIGLLSCAVLLAAWAIARTLRPGAGPGPAAPSRAQPAGRQVLVIGFGNLWLFDGFLKAQPRIPLGLPSQVIRPGAASSPWWVRDMVDWGATVWSQHPVPAAAAAVWIEAVLGIWMLAAQHGALSRLAGLAGAGWGLIVWVFGDALGGILAPGQSWLTGAPGAALVYVVAGALIALPERNWHSPRLGRLILGGLGLFLAGMAVLQAWPGRGSWQGSSRGEPGTLAGLVQSMAVQPQPGFLSRWAAAFAAFDESHGFAVNLLAVAVLAVTGAVFLSGRRRWTGPVLLGFLVMCLADWVLIQDLGFLGGLGTDPGSMIPFALLALGGYLALTGPGACPKTCANSCPTDDR
jgi:hypothetical protein